MAAKNSQKGRKINRNQKWCEGYTRAEKQILSHIRRAWKHVCRYGATDHVAVHYLNNSNVLIKRRLKIPESVAPLKSECKRIAPAQKMPPVRAKARVLS